MTRNSGVPGSRSVLLVGNFAPISASYAGVSQELAERLERAGWRVIRSSYRRLRVLNALDMLRTCWTERNHYDVAHVEVYSGRAFLWAAAACGLLRRLGKPYVIGLHGGNLPNFFGAHAKRGRKFLQSAPAVVSPSPYLQKAFAAWRPDVQLIPNAINLQRYPSRARRHACPKLIWLRAFRKMYAPEMAVEALAAIAREFPDASLTMIGPDRKDGSLECALSRAHRLRVMDRVSFIAGIPKREVGFHLCKADIFLNTATIDNTPVSVMEALSCGLCVVSTNVGGIRDLLDDGLDSLLVDPNDAVGMAAAIRRVLLEDGLAEKLSNNALQKAKNFDWTVVLPRWQTLLSSARANR